MSSILGGLNSEGDLCSVQYRANVSWQSQLDTRSSMLEAIEVWGSRLEYRGSSFETLEEFFEDLDSSFRGNV